MLGGEQVGELDGLLRGLDEGDSPLPFYGGPGDGLAAEPAEAGFDFA